LNMSTNLPVLIIGAGISGLAFAQGLLKAGIRFRIYERDPALNARCQGYRFRIHGSGQAALAALLPPDLYSYLEASCAITPPGGIIAGGSFDALRDPSLGEIPGPYGANPPRPEVVNGGVEEPWNADRGVMRSVLMSNLEPFVNFGREFVGYDITDSGVRVQFRDGGEVEGRLVVGADGTWSRVRQRLMPGFTLLDTEGRVVYGKTLLTPGFEATFPKNCLRGLTLIQDRSQELPLSLLLEPMRFKSNEYKDRGELPDDYVFWLLSSRKDRHTMLDKELLSLSPERSAALSKEMTANWHPAFKALFDAQDVTKPSTLRIVSAPPDIPYWPPVAQVTLIGDAAHVMSPSAGHGATTALRDAATLAQILIESGLSKETIGRYEAEMRIYAGARILRSKVGGGWSFGMRDFEQLKSAERWMGKNPENVA
jgi:2-polyprenyl-6-methoxyphenol hydroxylase-like FAD-dependent oxidoreductase